MRWSTPLLKSRKIVEMVVTLSFMLALTPGAEIITQGWKWG